MVNVDDNGQKRWGNAGLSSSQLGYRMPPRTWSSWHDKIFSSFLRRVELLDFHVDLVGKNCMGVGLCFLVKYAKGLDSKSSNKKGWYTHAEIFYVCVLASRLSSSGLPTYRPITACI